MYHADVDRAVLRTVYLPSFGVDPPNVNAKHFVMIPRRS